MKRLQELVLPLIQHVEKRLPQVSTLRLDADQNPPYLHDAEQDAHDPMLQQVPLHSLAHSSDTPAALQSSVVQARSRGQRSIESSDVLCAVCAAAVEDALGNGTLVLKKVPSRMLRVHASSRDHAARCYTGSVAVGEAIALLWAVVTTCRPRALLLMYDSVGMWQAFTTTTGEHQALGRCSLG
jgi:hypothetical protein